MLTPQELIATEFTKSTFGGYDKKSVDDIFAAVSEDYATLYKENNILKSKLKVLVDKIEEYRSTEDAMRMALLTAQTMGDEIISDANAKRDQIMAETEQVVRAKIAAAQEGIKQEEDRLQYAKQQTAEFVEKIKSLIAEQDAFLSQVQELTEIPATAASDAAAAGGTSEAAGTVQTEAEIREEQIMDAAKQIDSAVAKIVDAEPTLTESANRDEIEKTKIFKTPPAVLDDDEPTSPRPKFNFDDLQFGSKYDTGRIK